MLRASRMASLIALAVVALAPIAPVAVARIEPTSARAVAWVDRVPHGTGLAIDVFGDGVYVAGDRRWTAHLRRYSLDGELIWARRVGRARYDEAYGVTAGHHGVFVVGQTNGAFPGERDGPGNDAFVARYSLGGRLLWARQIVGRMRIPLSQCGGEDMVCPDSEEAFGVAVLGRSVYVVGRADTRLAHAGPYERGYLLRYDVRGHRRWIRTFRQEAWAVDAGSAGIFVTSFLEPEVRRFRPDGTLVWVRRAARATFSAVDVVGRSVYLAGDRDMDGVVRRIMVDGERRWTTTIVSPDLDSLMGVTVRAGRVFAVGTTHGRFPDQPNAGGDWDLLIAELDRGGDIAWIAQIGGPGREQGRGIAAAPGSVFVTSGTAGRFLDLPRLPPSMLVLRYDV